MRYADTHNLSVALPLHGVYLDNVAIGQSLKGKELKESPFTPPSGRYQFLIHHTRLQVRAIQQLTYEDSVWLTIVREPSAVFESMFHYYHLHKFYGTTFDNLVWKIESNGDFGASESGFKNANSRYQGRLGKNQMTFDLGLDVNDFKQETFIKEAIKILDQTFHLVMLAERMDESLVLLKHLLCWSDEDVVAISRNVRKDSYRSYLSEHTVNTLERFNDADVKLYAYFKDKFDKQVTAFGLGRMEEEVASLRDNRDKVWKECGVQEAITNKLPTTATTEKDDKYHHLIIEYQVHTNGSYRQQQFCKNLLRSSLDYTHQMRWKQYHRFHGNDRKAWNSSRNAKKKLFPKRRPRKNSGANSFSRKNHLIRLMKEKRQAHSKHSHHPHNPR